MFKYESSLLKNMLEIYIHIYHTNTFVDGTYILKMILYGKWSKEERIRFKLNKRNPSFVWEKRSSRKCLSLYGPFYLGLSPLPPIRHDASMVFFIRSFVFKFIKNILSLSKVIDVF